MITVLGSLNADLVLETERFPGPGETLRARTFRRLGGGKGANQALAVARMGGRVALVGAVGDDDDGRFLCERLGSQGVDVRWVARREGVSSGMAWILLNAEGQNQIVLMAGANGSVGATDVDAARSVLTGSRAVLAQLEVPVSAVEAAIAIAADAGIPTFLNVAPYGPVPEETLRRCTWILANETEAAQLSGVDVGDPESAAAAATVVRRRCPKSAVAITLGPDGVWVDAPGFAGHIPEFPVEVVDTVGAGDTFVGAFAWRLTEGGGILEAARFACAAAALAVTRPGAQDGMPTRAEVEAFLQRGAGPGR